ncbi:hypothetical protein [Edaphobacter sp. 12200R-103]|uniref:hypothetical protein n=1 Tax=Edaphobacter sp. 12200R-103 TaxID=2703788 RepID=UPI00138B6BC9|nr:hypothetical protein [Edaphobacter sp. 12200R-103]QHS51101.1 hypothetical protein GWR55_04635 [Edaphobacter sp. 12200R-103]
MVDDKTKDTKSTRSDQFKRLIPASNGDGAFVDAPSINPERSSLGSRNPEPPAMRKDKTGLAQTEIGGLAKEMNSAEAGPHNLSPKTADRELIVKL